MSAGMKRSVATLGFVLMALVAISEGTDASAYIAAIVLVVVL